MEMVVSIYLFWRFACKKEHGVFLGEEFPRNDIQGVLFLALSASIGKASVCEPCRYVQLNLYPTTRN